MLRIFIIGLIGIFAFASSAMADDFKAQIKQAEELAKTGKSVEALAAMDRATTSIWLRTPLAVAKAFYVTKKATAFGEYSKRADNIFPKNSKLRIYSEIIGYGWEKIDDLYKINVTVDASVENAAGKIIWSKKSFGKFRPERNEQFKNLYINLSLNISGVPAGEYTIEYTFIDKVRNQVATIKLPFVAQ